MSKIFQLSATPTSASDVMRRREKANAFCEAIRALDTTGFSLFIYLFLADYVLCISFTFILWKYISSHELQLKVDCKWY